MIASVPSRGGARAGETGIAQPDNPPYFLPLFSHPIATSADPNVIIPRIYINDFSTALFAQALNDPSASLPPPPCLNIGRVKGA